MRIEIGGVDYSKYLSVPVTTQRTLNEELDTAMLTLVYMRDKAPIKPFTSAVFEEDGVETHYSVAVDNVKEIFGRRRYNHEITLIEETKITERIICEAKSFTQPLVRDYTDGKTIASYSRINYRTGEIIEKGVLNEGYLYSPIVYDGVLEIPLNGIVVSPRDCVVLGDIFVEMTYGKIIVAHSDFYGSEEEIIYDVPASTIDLSQTLKIDMPYNTGYYIVRIYTGNVAMGEYGGECFDIPIYIVPKSKAATSYTLESVTNILLDTAEPLRVGLDTPRFTLRYRSDEQREIFRGTVAPPQLSFSNGRSLWENLREIGRIVHAIPHIEGNDLYFDELGGSEYADLSKGRIFGYSDSFNMADYTAALEANVGNLIDTDDISTGTITEPFAGGETSLRTVAETARIKDETGIIATSFPIEKVTSLRYRFKKNDGTVISGVITPYVFEKNEYDLLSSYSGGFPESKTYALYYTQGSNHISGLWYRADDSGVAIVDSFKRPAIVNIIATNAGVSASDVSDDYPDMCFEVSYVTTVSARVRQHRVTYGGDTELVMAYNQSANKLSARAFGESLRGQIAMMGTTSSSTMWMFRKYSDVPKAGLLYDDENYISSVTTRIYKDFCVSQIALSTGYNELGSYADVNNLIRQYEIPSGEERFTVIEEFCDICTRRNEETNTAASSSVAQIIARSIADPASVARISVARVQTFDKDGEELTRGGVILPVVSYSIGNCLYFGFRFLDNYSAGKTSEVAPVDNAKYRLQTDVPYGDNFYSKARTLFFSLHNSASMPTDEAARLDASYNLPDVSASELSLGAPLVSLGDHPLIWHKDSADAGNISYQLHLVSSDGFIIGSTLARSIPLVSSSEGLSDARMYFFDRRINQLTGISDTRGALRSLDLSYAASNPPTITPTGIPPASFKSWAIIRGNEFLLGKNASDAPSVIYINIRRKR